MIPAAEKSEDRQGMASATGTLEGTMEIPRGGQFGSLVTYADGRGVVLYDGELKWGEWLESRSGIKILLLDAAGSDKRLLYVDESGNSLSGWLVAQRKARRRKLCHGVDSSPSPANQTRLRLFLGRILA